MSTYVDPSTDVVGGAETGREPLAKTAAYYRRSWSTGSPFSSMPSWNDLSHLPPSRRELIARPDLALVAMKRILGRVEGELEQEAAQREQLRLRREDRLARIRLRHGERHEAQRKLGVVPPTHSLGSALEQRRQLQGVHTATGIVEGDCADPTLDSFSNDAGIASRRAGAAVTQQLQRPMSHAGLTILDEDGAEAAGLRGCSPTCGGRSSPSVRKISRADASSPVAGMRSQHYSGLEGLLIPRFVTTSPTVPDEGSPSRPGSSPASRSRSPTRTPAPLNSPTRNGPAMLQGGGEVVVARTSGSGSPWPQSSYAAAPPTTMPVPSAGGVLPIARGLVERSGAAFPRNSTRHLSGALSSSIVAPTRSATVSSSIAAFNGGDRKAAPPLLGWAESHGQSLGKAPRRMPLHFEMGLARHDQCPNPWPAHMPGKNGHALSMPQVNINLRSNTIGDGSQGHALTPTIGKQPQPKRWNSSHSLAPASMERSAPQPPSPSTLARAARALHGGW